MNKFILSLAIVAIFAGGLFSQNQKWGVDKSHSTVGFTVSHLVIAEVDGKFSDFDVNMETNSKGDLVTVNALIKTSSVNTDNKDRDAHLRNDDFFNSEKYPDMKFVSTKIKKEGKNSYKITGNLTIRDVTKTVVLNAKYNGQVKDPWGNTKSGWTANTKINRFDYNLKWDKAIETGGLVVGKEVTINLKIEMALAK